MVLTPARHVHNSSVNRHTIIPSIVKVQSQRFAAVVRFNARRCRHNQDALLPATPAEGSGRTKGKTMGLKPTA